jgi:hypothetical protein
MELSAMIDAACKGERQVAAGLAKKRKEEMRAEAKAAAAAAKKQAEECAKAAALAKKQVEMQEVKLKQTLDVGSLRLTRNLDHKHALSLSGVADGIIAETVLGPDNASGRLSRRIVTPLVLDPMTPYAAITAYYSLDLSRFRVPTFCEILQVPSQPPPPTSKSCRDFIKLPHSGAAAAISGN